jgi:hypothetical protein
VPYYIRQAGRHVSGPFDTVAVREWLKDGRVTDEMELSTDRVTWAPSSRIPKLGGGIRRRRRKRR